MKEKSIKLLNQALADELSAVHQYMYFHFRLDDLGYEPLAGLLKRVAIEEMQHAETLAERILFLGGEVEMVVSDPVQKIHDAKEMLQRAKAMEDESAQFYNRAAQECAANADSASKKIFEDLVASEERHWDDFDRQAGFIERFGERYLALQSFRAEPEAGES
ncbi:MAG: bacterioferritin [Planctomycetes bacterium]|nr:bacterioferritin [Planctomycetota bacterium]